jgi:hypothetical protein
MLFFQKQIVIIKPVLMKKRAGKVSECIYLMYRNRRIDQIGADKSGKYFFLFVPNFISLSLSLSLSLSRSLTYQKKLFVCLLSKEERLKLMLERQTKKF